MLSQKELSFRGVRWVKPKRDGIARAQVTQLMAATLPLGTDHADALEQRTVGSPPVGQCLAELRVEPFLGRPPGLLHEAVNLAERQGPLQRLAHRVIADGGEHDALGSGVALASLSQKLDPACARQPEVSNHECHLCRLVMQAMECSQASLRRGRGVNEVVGPESTLERGGQPAPQHGIGIGDEEDRFGLSGR